MHKIFSLLIAVIWTCCAQAQGVESEINLNIKAGKIAGTLTVPPSTSAVWVVLIVAGSGPTDRDGNSPNSINNSLRMLAHALAHAGIASVRYDKRGVGGSAASLSSEYSLQLETYVEDVASWVALLKSDLRFQKIAVLGHSEGALVAMLAAKSSKPHAYISVAGAGRRASDVLRSQLAGKLPPELATENEQILVSLEKGKEVQNIPSALLALYRPSVQPYLVSWFRYSPAAVLPSLQMPVLLLQGTNDIQVDIRDFELLVQAAPKSMHRVVSGMNHILKLVEVDRAHQVASYNDIKLPISPALSTAIAQFLNTTTLGSG